METVVSSVWFELKSKRIIQLSPNVGMHPQDLILLVLETVENRFYRIV